MKATESALREIKDRIAAAMAEVEAAASAPEKKGNHWRLSQAARELHQCADEMQNILMRLRPR